MATIKRYIFTSAQSDTGVHQPTWRSLLALAKHYGAEIRVSRFAYDTSSHQSKKVKPGKGPAYNQCELKNLIDGRKLNNRFGSDDRIEGP